MSLIVNEEKKPSGAQGSAAENLVDKQAERDSRAVAIQQAGVSGLRYPLTVARRDGSRLQTTGEFTLSVAVPALQRGAHMSRFTEMLHEQLPRPFGAGEMGDFLRATCRRLEAKSAVVAVCYPFFVEKKAPVTGMAAYVDYEVELTGKGQLSAETGHLDVLEIGLSVTIPVTTLCPCSKAISEAGAHSQRGYVTLEVWPELKLPGLEVEALIDIAEESASCQIYALLKREDEKFVTERAYENPAFCEDLARDIAVRCAAHEGIARYRVKVRNVESIHNHDAFAVIESSGMDL